MENEENKVENAVSTNSTAENPTEGSNGGNESPVSTPNTNPDGNANEPKGEEGKTEKSFTQEQVNDLVRERLERERKSIYKSYGVEDKKGLDEIIEKAKLYDDTKKALDDLQSKFDEKSTQNAEMLEKLAFIENDINPSRYDDIRKYFKGGEIEFSRENLAKELTTHPEWRNVAQKSENPVTTVTNISPNRGKNVSDVEEDKKIAAKMFGLKKII